MRENIKLYKYPMGYRIYMSSIKKYLHRDDYHWWRFNDFMVDMLDIDNGKPDKQWI